MPLVFSALWFSISNSAHLKSTFVKKEGEEGDNKSSSLRIGCAEMKRRVLECKYGHGLTLHRCKRKYRRKQTNKNDSSKYYSEYSEKCFLCISEGRYEKKAVILKRDKHISFR